MPLVTFKCPPDLLAAFDAHCAHPAAVTRSLRLRQLMADACGYQPSLPEVAAPTDGRDAAPDPTRVSETVTLDVCAHPKSARTVRPYGTWCTDCQTRIR